MSAQPLTVAISSRALFDLHKDNEIFEKEGEDVYRKEQIAKENETLNPGDGFPLVKKLLQINQLIARQAGVPKLARPRVEVVLLSRNSTDTGLRVFNSIKKHGLDINRAAFCDGESPWRYVAPFGCHLFLSKKADDVRQARDEGLPAALLLDGGRSQADSQQELRIAFDGDAVLFSDEAERVYQEKGIRGFHDHEKKKADTPLPPGPLSGFLEALHALQNEFSSDPCPIRTALVTARGAPAHERVIYTLRQWQIRLDEALFLGGDNKDDFLKAFGADIFFDDKLENCESAAPHTPAGQVPSDLERANEPPAGSASKVEQAG